MFECLNLMAFDFLRIILLRASAKYNYYNLFGQRVLLIL